MICSRYDNISGSKIVICIYQLKLFLKLKRTKENAVREWIGMIKSTCYYFQCILCGWSRKSISNSMGFCIVNWSNGLQQIGCPSPMTCYYRITCTFAHVDAGTPLRTFFPPGCIGSSCKWLDIFVTEQKMKINKT